MRPFFISLSRSAGFDTVDEGRHSRHERFTIVPHAQVGAIRTKEERPSASPSDWARVDSGSIVSWEHPTIK